MRKCRMTSNLNTVFFSSQKKDQFADVFDDVIDNVRASSGIRDIADDCTKNV